MQQTLTGGEAFADRQRPRTLVYCPQCDDTVLRSRTDDHRHELHAPPLWTNRDRGHQVPIGVWEVYDVDA